MTAMTDHPRSRGVYQWAGCHLGDWAGIIPARAGFTRCGRGAMAAPEDHPRSRGVYASPSSIICSSRGSSPLARGLPSDPDVAGERVRIIPARAGFTRRRGGRSGPASDHPRSRGVYCAGCPRVRRARGSSPLARGLQDDGEVGGPGRGIIPARAGFTGLDGRGDGRRRDHPRSRGVYSPSSKEATKTPGSSPLARGLQAQGPHRRDLRGIIPARAGFTHGAGAPDVRGRDHPRSRGVYAVPAQHRAGPPGSSPLARGLPRSGGARPGPIRIIPARAGFTSFAPRLEHLCEDHPRSRGVYTPSSHGDRPR